MKLNLTPSQIRKLSPNIIAHLAYCEEASLKNNGTEAEVFYFDKIKQEDKIYRRYIIITHDPYEEEGHKYNTRIYSDASNFTGNWMAVSEWDSLEMALEKVPEDIEKAKQLYFNQQLESIKKGYTQLQDDESE